MLRLALDATTMDWTVSLQDISDDQLRQALAQAQVPALMAALVHLTSSTDHLRGDIRPLVEQLAEERRRSYGRCSHCGQGDGHAETGFL